MPGNAVGWLLSLIGLLLAVAMGSEQYAIYGLVTAPGSLPAARVVGWFSPTLITVIALLFLAEILLFPDGRLPSRRWRPVGWAIVVSMAGAVAGQLQASAFARWRAAGTERRSRWPGWGMSACSP